MRKKLLIEDYKLYIVVIAFLITIVFIYLNYKEGLFLLSLLLFCLYCYELMSHNKKQWTKYVENLSKDVDIATRHAVEKMPMPIVLIDNSGKMIWYNSKFLELAADNKIINRDIRDIIPYMKLEDLDMDSNEEIELKFKEKTYGVNYSILDLSQSVDKSEYMIMLYFIDKTENIILRDIYEEEKLNIGFIYIDNYEDLMEKTDEDNRSMLLVEVDKKLNKLSESINSIIKKTDRNKYLLVFENKNLNLVQKFDILDEIRNIKLGNTIPVTLSMGIGIGGESLRETYKFAKAAMDIALGRGGDQAVIKDNDKLSFYGGNIQTIEKRSKVRARVISYALKQLIDQSKTIFIMGHKVGDMDSFGASIGIYRIVKNRGKKCFIVLNSINSSIENIYDALEREQPDYIDDIITYDKAKNMSFKSSICIVVDTHIPKQTEAPGMLEKVDKVIVIDHHRRGESFIEEPVLSYVEPYASSTCELITEMLYYIEEDAEITKFDAKALLAGIAVDTKNFAVNTGVRTFEAASFLKERGVDTLEVRKLFQNDLNDFRNKGEIIKNITMFGDGIAISKLERDVDTGIMIAAQVSDEILNIKDIKAAFVLVISGDDIHISGRSTEKINVQRILEKLGGGGHMTVAGARVSDSNIDEVEEMLKSAITEYLEEGEEK